MDNNVISKIRTSKGFSRSVSVLIILALLGVTLERVIYFALQESEVIEEENIVERLKRQAPQEARKLGLNNQVEYKPKPLSVEGQFAKGVQSIKDELSVLNSSYETIDVDKVTTQIVNTRTELQSLNNEVLAKFEKTAQHIQQHNLSEQIQQRYTNTLESYQQQYAELMQKLSAVETATTLEDKKAQLEAVQAYLAEQQFQRSQQEFNPNNMPFNSAKPNPENKPKFRAEDYTAQGLFNTPNVQLAALGDFTFDALPGANDPAYLEATDEVLLSQPVLDLAASLNHDPVSIYHWVRNNIEWQPTWGAVQDAELTLDAKRGNAMDIASLTIALFRASQIPARYVHGSIEIPEAKFRNWAGGFSSIDAAVDFAASGGVPTRALISGGKITEVQIEHVWVEVAVDYFPSKAAKNIDADTWLPIDPSFKQYEYLAGLDVVQISGIDTDQLAQDVLNSGAVNETEGWVTGFDPAILQTAQTSAQIALESHITNNMVDPTVGDVIGGRKTIVQEYPVLATGLSNRMIVAGARYNQLPTALQQQVTYSFSSNVYSASPASTTFAWSTINNEKVSLSFKPATADDEAALQSLLPEGEITDISQLPSEIPAYLIEVLPELKVNGVVKLTGNPMNLGQELHFKTQIKHPGRSSQINYTYKIPAGSYVSVNVVAGNVSSSKLTALQTQLAQTKGILESNDPAQLGNLTREDILGDMFYTGTLGYFAQLLGFNQVGAQQANTQYYLSAGYGTFGYEPKVDYVFGLPTAVQPGGVVLDIPLNIVTAHNDGDRPAEIDFKLQSGVISSALEHITPEQLFNNDPLNPPNGFSTVKGLQIAAAAGQRIYQITSANIATTLPALNLDTGTEAEIEQAVSAGKEVITHTDLVSVPGYTGAGYIIFDPVTGDGAYKIAGGGNGGWFYWLTVALQLAVVTSLLIFIMTTGLTLLSLVAVSLTIKSYLGFLDGIKEAKSATEINQISFGAWVGAGLGAVPAIKTIGIQGKLMTIMVNSWITVFNS